MLDKLVILVLLAGLAQAQISVQYLVQFNESNGQCGGTDLAPITVSVPTFSTALSVMEAAVSSGMEYQFEVTFSKESRAGYTVDVLNATRARYPCYWTFYVRSPDGQEIKSSIPISSYIVAYNYSIILRYEKRTTSMYTTIYAIEYPDPICTSNTNSTAPDSISVTTSQGSSALDVMEQAVRDRGVLYSFSASFEGGSSAYTILEINSLRQTSSCSWVAFVTPSGGSETRLVGSVSEYTIPADGHRLTLRYMEPQLPTTITTMTATTGSAKGLLSYHNAALVLSGVLLILNSFFL